jgi:hypothetical protein
LPFPVHTKNLGGEIKQVAHFVPSNFYKFETHEMTNFNIPPPSNQYTGNLTASQVFFQGKRRAHQVDYRLIRRKLIPTGVAWLKKWEVTDLKSADSGFKIRRVRKRRVLLINVQ